MKEQKVNSWNVEKQGLKKRRRKLHGKDPRDVDIKR
jgi:hypothetical protein